MITWIDCETSGLDERIGELLEVALVVTDDDLNEVAATSFVVQPATPLGFDFWRERLDPFIQDMHGKSGLLDVIARGDGLHIYDVEERLRAWVRAVADSEGADLKKTPLAGSTVGFDRAWLKGHVPAIESMFSYRAIDVSSLTELASRWAPAVYEGRPQARPEEIKPRALVDVRESIAILRYYRECGFVGGRG